MAGIDRTYTNSYQEYKDFKDWADTQFLIFFDGHKVCIGDWVYDLNESDFDNGERAIMNTPTWLDIYLIQNCKSEFVLNRMKVVYGEKDYNSFKTIKLNKLPEDFKQNRKIVIGRGKRTRFPLHSKPYGGYTWWLQSNSGFNYNDETKRWISDLEYYPTNTNTSHPKSLKGLVRHLRKQYLPKGAIFNLSGRYVGEEYIVKVV